LKNDHIHDLVNTSRLSVVLFHRIDNSTSQICRNTAASLPHHQKSLGISHFHNFDFDVTKSDSPIAYRLPSPSSSVPWMNCFRPSVFVYFAVPNMTEGVGKGFLYVTFMYAVKLEGVVCPAWYSWFTVMRMPQTSSSSIATKPP
jgi:hypothetical protein